MGYMTDGLTLNTLRKANAKRNEIAWGGKCVGWTSSQWLQAIVGELGEYANLRKKFERGDLSSADFQAEAAKELADVLTYLDLLADHLSIDLGRATIQKFNEVSRRIGSRVYIKDDGSDYGLWPETEDHRVARVAKGLEGTEFAKPDGGR